MYKINKNMTVYMFVYTIMYMYMCMYMHNKLKTDDQHASVDWVYRVRIYMIVTIVWVTYMYDTQHDTQQWAVLHAYFAVKFIGPAL